MLTLTFLLAVQLVAASCMPQADHAESEMTIYDSPLYEQLFGDESNLDQNPETDANIDFINTVISKYLAEFSAKKDVTTKDVDDLLGEHNCDRKDMTLRLGLSVLIHNDRPQLTGHLVNKFQYELTDCLGNWFEQEPIGHEHIEALLKSLVDSENTTISDWAPLTRNQVLNGLIKLGFSDYGDEMLARDSGESFADMKENFELHLKANLPSACNPFVREWRLIYKPWSIIARGTGENLKLDRNFSDFLKKYEACSVIVPEPGIMEHLSKSKYQNLYKRIFLPQTSATLTPDQTKNALELMLVYCEDENIAIIDKRVFEDFDNDCCNRIEPTWLDVRAMNQMIHRSDNQNIIELARHMYEINFNNALMDLRFRFNELINVQSRTITDEELNNVDKLIEIVDNKRRTQNRDIKFIDTLEREVLNDALVEFWALSAKPKRTVGCFKRPKQPAKLTKRRLEQLFGNVCNLIGTGPERQWFAMVKLGQIDYERVRQYIEEVSGLMQWMRRVEVCSKMFLTDIEYHTANAALQS